MIIMIIIIIIIIIIIVIIILTIIITITITTKTKSKTKTKIKIALLQHSLLHDSNVIPTPKGSISSLLHYGAVRKEKLDPATSGSKKNDHCTAETLV